jgi:hypothetical protein
LAVIDAAMFYAKSAAGGFAERLKRLAAAKATRYAMVPLARSHQCQPFVLNVGQAGPVKGGRRSP